MIYLWGQKTWVRITAVLDLIGTQENIFCFKITVYETWPIFNVNQFYSNL